jgi:hypothetical protein
VLATITHAQTRARFAAAGITEDIMAKQAFIENKVREATEERQRRSGTKTAKISETKRTKANGAQKLKQKQR